MIIQHLPQLNERGAIVDCLCKKKSANELWTTHVDRVLNDHIQNHYDQGFREGYDEGFQVAAGIAS